MFWAFPEALHKRWTASDITERLSLKQTCLRYGAKTKMGEGCDSLNAIP